MDISCCFYYLVGCILVDNHDIQDIRLKSLREHIVLVPQDIVSPQISVVLLLIYLLIDGLQLC